MQFRPKTSCSQILTSPSNSQNIIATLQLSLNRKLLEQFPKDNHADVTIQIKNKRFELQKAHLRIESLLFDTDKQLICINEYDPDIFEGILKCIYGGQYQIMTYSELYQAYQISSFIKCETLCKQIENQFIIDKKSFTLAFQLSELYGLEDLRHNCYEYLSNTLDAFLQIFDIGILKIKKSQKKSLPTDVLGLTKQCFIQLVQVHNTYKQNKQNIRKFLSNLELFQLLEIYSTDEDYLKDLIIQLIPRDQLTSDEYEQIYHSLAIKQSSLIAEEPSIQKFHPSIKDFKQFISKPEKSNQDYFDLEKSENYLIKKRMFEYQEQNQTLKQEISKLTIALETSMKSTTNLKDSLLDTISQQLDKKLFEKDKEIDLLKQEVQTLKSELFQKEKTIVQLQESEEKINYQQSELIISETTNSQYFNNQELIESQIQIIKPQQTTQTIQLSVSQVNKFDCDTEPLTLDNQNQLNFMFDHLGITIFSQIFLRRQYLGSRDGYDVCTFEQKCGGVENLLILFRVFDYNRIVGIQFIEDKKYLLNISNQTIQEIDQVILFQNNLIHIPGILTVSDECGSNQCYGSNKLTGDREFQVDEIEAYSVQISHQL